MEVGTGPALLSGTEIDNRRFSIAFQFGSHIGLGLRFGPKHRYEVSYRFMHYSNANLKVPQQRHDLQHTLAHRMLLTTTPCRTYSSRDRSGARRGKY